MQLLIPTGHEADDLIAVDVENHELARCWVTLGDNLGKRVLWLTNEVDLLITNAEVIHVEIVELDLLVHHVHRCIESLLDVVLHVVGSDTDLVQEGREVGARAGCQQGRVDIVIKQRETDV